VLGPADRDDPATFLALGDPAWTHCGTDSSCRSPAACWPGPGAARAPPRRAGTAVAAAKIASFAAIAGAGVPAVGALDLRHPDLEMAVPARTALLARGGVLGVPAPGTDRLLALPVRHGDAESVRAARRFDAEESGLFAGQFHHAVGRGAVAVVAFAALRAEHHRVVRRRGKGGEGRGHGDGSGGSLLAGRQWCLVGAASAASSLGGGPGLELLAEA